MLSALRFPGSSKVTFLIATIFQNHSLHKGQYLLSLDIHLLSSFSWTSHMDYCYSLITAFFFKFIQSSSAYTAIFSPAQNLSMPAYLGINEAKGVQDVYTKS